MWKLKTSLSINSLVLGNQQQLRAEPSEDVLENELVQGIFKSIFLEGFNMFIKQILF